MLYHTLLRLHKPSFCENSYEQQLISINQTFVCDNDENGDNEHYDNKVMMTMESMDMHDDDDDDDDNEEEDDHDHDHDGDDLGNADDHDDHLLDDLHRFAH